jgi:hypothetical protein
MAFDMPATFILKKILLCLQALQANKLDISTVSADFDFREL